MAFLYEKDPAAIYDLSFQRVKTSLVPFDLHPSIEPLITRLVHACGMPDIVLGIGHLLAFINLSRCISKTIDTPQAL